MSFDVHITIVGICNFIEGTKKLHITMPRDHHHPHAGRLYYDRAYQSAQSAATKKYRREFFAHTLDGAEVDVPAHTSDIDTDLPTDIVAAGDLRWGKVKAEMLNASHGQGSKAVITFNCGGVSDYISTRTFEVDGKEMQPANVITWTIRGITKPTFDFTITRDIGPSTVTLHPMRGCIRMFLVNVPADELPNKGFHVFPSNVTGRLDHIDEFMSLYQSSRKVKVVETAKPVVAWHDESEGLAKAAQASGVSLLTWVGACFSLRGQT